MSTRWIRPLDGASPQKAALVKLQTSRVDVILPQSKRVLPLNDALAHGLPGWLHMR